MIAFTFKCVLATVAVVMTLMALAGVTALAPFVAAYLMFW